MARQAEGTWRLHRDLAAINPTLQLHATRRVKALRPTEAGHFEFLRRNQATDDLGVAIFDLYVRFVSTQGES